MVLPGPKDWGEAMTVSLDDPAVAARYDPDGSYERINGLPEQCGEAWEAARGFELPPSHLEVEKIVVVGMGGSAIAADHLQALAFASGSLPVTVVRGYSLPHWVDGRTLVVACSHSGNTEETLAAFSEALDSDARNVVITTGGRAGEIAHERELPVMLYSYPNVPRDAFGHGLIRLLAVAKALGMHLIDDASAKAAFEQMRQLRAQIQASVPEAQNPAKKLARSLEDSLPLTVGAEFLAPVARRWCTQINENAKTFAFWDDLPELDHNLVVGLKHRQATLASTRAIFLDNEGLHPRTRLRYELTAELFQRSGIACERIELAQKSRLAAQLCGVLYGDFVSYYLALLKGARPVEVDNINWLKERLAER